MADLRALFEQSKRKLRDNGYEPGECSMGDFRKVERPESFKEALLLGERLGGIGPYVLGVVGNKVYYARF